MASPYVARRARNILVGAAGMLAVGVLTNPARTFGQSKAAATPEFEVASVRIAKPVQTRDNGSRGGNGRGPSEFNVDPRHVIATNTTLKALFRWAYSLQPYQLAGGPPWLDQETYDVTAQAASPSSPDELRLMLRTLLADRFQLKFHTESKAIGVMALVVAKSGPKLHEAEDRPPSDGDGKPFTGPIGMGPLFQGLTMEDLATRLSGVCGTLELPMGPVVDMTGLKGKYDLRLMTKPNPDAVGSTGQRTVIDQVCEALPQDGLEFKRQRVPMQIYIVDSAEKVPTAN